MRYFKNKHNLLITDNDLIKGTSYEAYSKGYKVITISNDARNNLKYKYKEITDSPRLAEILFMDYS